jgi:hypothetical protein
VRAAVGTVTGIVARFTCAVSPLRTAHASNAHIQSGRLGGRSRAGIGVSSACVIVVPYRRSGTGASGVITGWKSVSSWFHESQSLANASALVI